MNDAELLTNEQAHPIALFQLLTKKYGIEWTQWPPFVLRRTIDSDFNISMAKINVVKALAAAAVATRDEFWTDWEKFHFLCQALNNNFPEHENIQEHTVGQMMVAVDIATQIRKELGDLGHIPEFSEQVARYIASHALNQGIWHLPEPLAFAEAFAARKSYRCLDCGNVDEVHFSDGLCDYCVERFDTDQLGSWTPNPALVKRGRGKNIEYFEKNPIEPIRDRLTAVLGSPKMVLQENPTDICVAKLLVALSYVQHRRDQLKEQG
jgi:hypothetical protein